MACSSSWRIGILCSRTQINLDILLNCGQSFRWKRQSDMGWIGVIRDHVWRLRQTESGIWYIVYGEKPNINKQFPRDIKESNLSLGENTHTIVEQNGCSAIPPLESGKPANLDHVTCLKSEAETINQCEKRGKKERKRSANKIENSHNMTAKKLMKTMDSTKPILNASMAPCSLPSSLVKRDEIKIETLKQMYLREGMQHYDDDIKYVHASEDCEQVLRDYFQTGIDLGDLYDHWSSRDSHFKAVAGKFEGIRMLRQDPTENLLSFVCSSNNHISRISSMVEKLCIHYGAFIAEVDGEKYFSFPKMSALTGDDVEGHLRQLGFGYRAKFISAIAKFIHSQKDEGWLESLRDDCSYSEAKSELVKLMGVGAKVADCVCLMSLDKPEAVPVDTHVWQITLKNYLAKLQTAKSLTNKIYNEIGDFYRDLWGPYAGWAHSVLFTADLRHNKTKAESSDASSEKLKSQQQHAKTKTGTKSISGGKNAKCAEGKSGPGAKRKPTPGKRQAKSK